MYFNLCVVLLSSFIREQSGEITCGTRDGAAQVLRCLKMWYELPSDVLFTAVNLVDRFLTKMKVKPKHIACISVGSFLLAVNQLGLPKMDTDDLVTISQVIFTYSALYDVKSIQSTKKDTNQTIAFTVPLHRRRPGTHGWHHCQ